VGTTDRVAARERQWDGALDRSDYSDGFVRGRDELADAARDAQWERVLGLLRDPKRRLMADHWRVGGASWFTPLHQAAWSGAPEAVVAELLELGASRALVTADGRTARDIAAAHGHDALVPLLEPESRNPANADVLAILDRRLVDLVEHRIRPCLTVGLRPFPTVTLTELEWGTRVWLPVPGMYGGFSVALMCNYLDVQSWSRVVGGSGQAHVITAQGTVLVDEGLI